MLKLNIIGLLLFISELAFANTSPREICITIDDLPFVGASSSAKDQSKEKDRFYKIIQTLVNEQVPATGFVIAGSIAKKHWQLLQEFKNQGFILGNHTYSHENLDRIGASKYISDIAKADQILNPLMNGRKYFRYPYLAEGHGKNKGKVLQYLKKNQYTIAPVTIDSKDFRFNAQYIATNWRNRSQILPKIKQRYLDYIWAQTQKAERMAHNRPTKQILLIHSNMLNSQVLGDVIHLYKVHGYRFITLDDALSGAPQPLRTEDTSTPKLNDLS